MKNKYIRHDLNPEDIKKSIDHKIAENERRRIDSKDQSEKMWKGYHEAKAKGKSLPPPNNDGTYIDPMYDEWNKNELEIYSTVRVIENIEKPLKERRFRLCYGKNDEKGMYYGTGPFGSLKEAIKWFTNNGR